MFIRDLPPTYKNILILLGGCLTAWLIYRFSAVIAPFLVSIVFAYILNPIIRFFEKIKIPRPYGVLGFYIFAVIAGILIVIPVVLNIVSEGHDLLARLSQIDVKELSGQYKVQARSLVDRYSQMPWVKNYLELSLNSERVQDIGARAVVITKDVLVQIMKNMFSFLFSAISGVAGLFFIPLLTFYILVDLDMFYKQALMLVPHVYRESVARIAGDIDTVLSGFLRGQILACTIFGSLMTFGLWLSGLHFFVLLGPLAGVANLIPYLGGLLTIILSVCVAVSQYGKRLRFKIDPELCHSGIFIDGSENAGKKSFADLYGEQTHI